MSRRLPVPLRTVAGPLARAVSRLEGRGAPDRIVHAAREAGLTPVTVLAGPKGTHLPDAPQWVLIHEPSPPDARARFYEIAASTPSLAISTREWEVWSGGVVGHPSSAPVWGEALPRVEDDEVEDRRRALRHAAELLWWELPRGMHRDAPAGAAVRAAESFRRVCERQTLPSRFPAIPPAGADSDAVFAATFGVAHATFAGEVTADDGPRLDPEARPESPAPHADALAALERTLLADLPRHIQHEMLALYLLPGPWGTLHAHQLVAVVADDSPLHRAAALRRRLSAHLGLVDRDLLVGACADGTEPLVLSLATLHGQLRRRLWRRPLRRLALRLGARRLMGEDVIYDGLQGTDFVGTDLRAEVAALISVTGGVFRGGSAAQARELIFGAWPRVIALAAGRSPLEPLDAVHADLAGRTDRALSRVGSAARTQPWGDPVALDRGRAAPLLREWGPALIRLQEVALEVLG
ncbi:MAG: hypothetical protein KDA24_09735 [Deltaproteobacteria bacterium]|nr:hypothetical protein [Deltaproteobacteria bacterium]